MADISDPTALRTSRGPDRVPLAMDGDAFREAGYNLIDRIAQMLDDLPERRVNPGMPPARVRAALGEDDQLPTAGRDPVALLAEVTELMIEHSLFNGHPKFFGYITASPTPVGMLSDLLAAAVNPNVGAWVLSPMASEVEAQTVRWIADLLNVPRGCGGLLVSGGNMANLVGFWAARAAAGAAWRIRERGVGGEGAPPLVAYVSAEAHTWVQKAADLAGMGTDRVRWIGTDADLRMDVAELRAAIATDRAAGALPMVVVGSAGTVMTGAVDPLREMGELCREEEIWFHVDGAYGGFAAASGYAPVDLREGLAGADSIAVDPHKWLYAPLEAGCALVRRPEALRAAFAYHPPYYAFGEEAVNFVDYGPQNSRGFRALKVWMALRQAGREGYERMIGDDILLARHLHARVAATPELEPMAQGLSISAFRYVPEELAERSEDPAVAVMLDELNEALRARIEVDGEAFLSNAVIRGRYALRACIVNMNTTVADVEAVPELVRRVGRALYAERSAADASTRRVLGTR